jgi:hypothetical protein
MSLDLFPCSRIWGSHTDGYVEFCLLGYNACVVCWKRRVPPKRPLTFNRLHGLISQKIEYFLTPCRLKYFLQYLELHLLNTFDINFWLKIVKELALILITRCCIPLALEPRCLQSFIAVSSLLRNKRRTICIPLPTVDIILRWRVWR